MRCKSKNKPDPAYTAAYKGGMLQRSAKTAFQMLKACSLCPRKCKINRLNNEAGFCKTGLNPRVFSFCLHRGEEPPISGTNGSGTIFFSGCNMACVYCQNSGFSQKKNGKEVTAQELADIMLQLQNKGAHNINLVTPTHIMPQILRSLEFAIPNGLKIPLIYNTSGYELPEAIKLLEGIVDTYLADMRYGDNAAGLKYSLAPDYPKYNQPAIKEMYRQAGVKGLIIRHLVLPNNISATEKVMKFIAQNLSKETYISLMSQYMPLYNACQFKELSRRIMPDEYQDAQTLMHKWGLYNGWTQEAYGEGRLAGINIEPSYL